MDTPSKNHPADHLMAALEQVGNPACVGLDPVLDRLPASCRAGAQPLAAIERFCLGVLDAISGHVGVCKIQSACFERYGAAGVEVIDTIGSRAGELGLQVILDYKRGDIGISAEHYAASARGRCDWVTVNPYLGVDGIAPFVAADSLGAFALVRTSNPGGDAIQSNRLEDGRTVAQSVADLVASHGEATIGRCGYSALGAVVGATKREDAEELRRRMPRQIFLVPGFGAQGGGVDDVLPCFNSDGAGAIITASRSILYAFETEDPEWQSGVERAARDLGDSLAKGMGTR
ncbi:MAG: orotidine-5'-phosphate decarboxylase [Phycisphaerae bacterium]|nr:orotidine-5'-phosphate decarboxylase [Phycisphaerae bacterium]